MNVLIIAAWFLVFWLPQAALFGYFMPTSWATWVSVPFVLLIAFIMPRPRGKPKA